VSIFKSTRSSRHSVIVSGRASSGRSTYVREACEARGIVPLIISFGNNEAYEDMAGILVENLSSADEFRSILKQIRSAGSLEKFSEEVSIANDLDVDGQPIVCNAIIVDGIETLSSFEIARLEDPEKGVTRQIWGKMGSNVQNYLLELRNFAPLGFYGIVVSIDETEEVMVNGESRLQASGEKLGVNPDLEKRLRALGRQVYCKVWVSRSGKLGGYTVQENSSLAVQYIAAPLEPTS
jgi:hypothetical protein